MVMAEVCQVHYWGIDKLTCPYYESGGRQCERLDPHDEEGHRWGRHTIEHERAGNGHSCEAVDASDGDLVKFTVLRLRW